MAESRKDFQINTRVSAADVKRLDDLRKRTMPMATRASFALAVLRAGMAAGECDSAVLLAAATSTKKGCS